MTIWTRDDANALWAMLKGWEGAAKAGVPMVVSIKTHRDKRSAEQNRRYWAVLGIISDLGSWVGPKFSRDQWHIFFKDKFLPKTDGPMGTTIPGSTQDLDIKQMTDYMTEVEVWAGETLQIDFLEVA